MDRPDAFLPDLAGSLGTLSLTLVGAERFAEVAAAAREGLEAILPFAEVEPQAFGGLADALARDLIEASKEAGQEPDHALLERGAKVLRGGPSPTEQENDDPDIAALKAKVGLILAEAKRTGELDEDLLAALPEEIANFVRTAWQEAQS